MNMKQWLAGIVGGAIVIHVFGYIVYGNLLASFFKANVGSATGGLRADDQRIVWAVVVAELAYASLIMFVLSLKSGSLTMATAIKVGATVAFLLWVCANFMWFGVTNIQNLTATIADPLVELVRGGITGAVLGILLPKLAGAMPRHSI